MKNDWRDALLRMTLRAWEAEDKVRELEAKLIVETDRRLDAEAQVEEMDVTAHLVRT